MGEDAIQSTEYVGQVPQACLRATACLGTQRKATWKMLWRCEDVGGPIERMAAVVNRAAGFRGVMDGAQILPLGCTHLRTRLRGAWRVFGEESNDQVIYFHGEETTEFVEPQGLVHPLGRSRKLYRNISTDRHDGLGPLRSGEVVVERFQMFLKLEWRVELLGNRGPG